MNGTTDAPTFFTCTICGDSYEARTLDQASESHSLLTDDHPLTVEVTLVLTADQVGWLIDLGASLTRVAATEPEATNSAALLSQLNDQI